jgi:hypothetical protein
MVKRLVQVRGATVTDFDPRKDMLFLKSIPTVDPADLKGVWQMQDELLARHGSGFAVALDLYKRACRPGAHVWSVWYRCSQFETLRNFYELTGTNLPWLHDGKPDEAVFKALAVVPMTKMPPGGREGLPFDVEELIRLIQKDSEP